MRSVATTILAELASRRIEASDSAEPSFLSNEAVEKPPTPSPLRDVTLAATVLASIAILALCGLYISLRWASIPDVLAMQFSRDGAILAYGQREDIFKLPGIGAAILIVFARALARPALPGAQRPRFGRL